MSYSHTVKAKTKEECMEALREKLDETIRSQPCHEKDKASALNAAQAYLDLLKPVPEGHHIEISIHGSLGWNGTEPELITGAGVGVSARIDKTPE